MFANRISGFLLQQPARAGSVGSPAANTPSISSSVPDGFIPLPAGMLSAMPQVNIYHLAYEAAKAAAREKLLELLRARAGWN